MAIRPVTTLERGGGDDTDDDAKFGRQAPHFQRMRRAVAGGAQEHRVAEGQQTAIADQEVERTGE